MDNERIKKAIDYFDGKAKERRLRVLRFSDGDEKKGEYRFLNIVPNDKSKSGLVTVELRVIYASEEQAPQEERYHRRSFNLEEMGRKARTNFPLVPQKLSLETIYEVADEEVSEIFSVEIMDGNEDVRYVSLGHNSTAIFYEPSIEFLRKVNNSGLFPQAIDLAFRIYDERVGIDGKESGV